MTDKSEILQPGKAADNLIRCYTHRAKMFSSLTSKMITLAVGPEKSELHVHKHVLCESSPFFQTACKPEWMEPENPTIELPEDVMGHIQAMVDWMYHDTIYVTAEAMDQERFTTCAEAMQSAWGLFVGLYVLGDKFQMPRLRNAAIDALIFHEIKYPFTLGVVPFAYDNTAPGSALRKLIVCFAKGSDVMRHDLRVFETESCPEFFFEILEDVFKNKQRVLSPASFEVEVEDPRIDYCARYHQHSEPAVKGEAAKCSVYMLQMYVTDDFELEGESEDSEAEEESDEESEDED